MMISQCKEWQAFKIKGKKFLALIGKDGTIDIYDVRLFIYGSWFSVKNFKKNYAKNGEKLCLDKTDIDTVKMPQLKVVG